VLIFALNQKFAIILGMPKKILSIFSGLLIISGLFLFFSVNTHHTPGLLSPLVKSNFPTPSPRPMEKYYFDNLAKREYKPTEIKLEKEYLPPSTHFEPIDGVKTWLFSYQSDDKRVSGMANLPGQCTEKSPCPIIVMLRGYVDNEIYFSGIGTHKSAGVFAKNDFITLAPDFLGFGESDYPDKDVLKTRFTRPITVLNLLASIKQWPLVDENKIFLWGHSNGGQIALSVLEITGEKYPTTLWAPVTIGFPDAVTYYMDEYDKADENGKKIYNLISEYSKKYSTKNVSIDYYWDKINAPIQIHQGGADVWVPAKWSEEFVNQIRLRGKTVHYHYYPKADHNLKQNWDEVVEKDLNFYKKYMLK
jgi:dipeptidyl aminopeptidase/acylaminoacyl peptidase